MSTNIPNYLVFLIIYGVWIVYMLITYLIKKVRRYLKGHYMWWLIALAISSLIISICDFLLIWLDAHILFFVLLGLVAYKISEDSFAIVLHKIKRKSKLQENNNMECK